VGNGFVIICYMRWEGTLSDALYNAPLSVFCTAHCAKYMNLGLTVTYSSLSSLTVLTYVQYYYISIIIRNLHC